MKKVLLIALLLFSFIGLVGCAQITSGEVYKMEFRPAYTEVRTLSGIIPDYYIIRFPDRYVIHIKAHVNGKMVKEDFYVDKETFNQINVGDRFEYDPKRGDMQYEPYSTEK